MPNDEADLTAALQGLSQLLTGHSQLEDTLDQIAEFAVQAIPGADGAGLTLLADDQRAQTVVSSAAFVREIDAVQYGIGEGPCITAAAGARTVVSGSLGGESQWPRFGPRVGRMGVHSALSLPLMVPGRMVGAMNVYARARDAFTTEAVRLGELFAVPAAVSVVNAQLLADSRRLIDQLSQALASRAAIDQARGLIMSREGVSAGEAFERLVVISQLQNRKLRVVAQDLLDEAVARAAARPRPTPPLRPQTAGRAPQPLSASGDD